MGNSPWAVFHQEVKMEVGLLALWFCSAGISCRVCQGLQADVEWREKVLHFSAGITGDMRILPAVIQGGGILFRPLVSEARQDVNYLFNVGKENLHN